MLYKKQSWPTNYWNVLSYEENTCFKAKCYDAFQNHAALVCNDKILANAWFKNHSSVRVKWFILYKRDWHVMRNKGHQWPMIIVEINVLSGKKDILRFSGQATWAWEKMEELGMKDNRYFCIIKYYNTWPISSFIKAINFM